MESFYFEGLSILQLERTRRDPAVLIGLKLLHFFGLASLRKTVGRINRLDRQKILNLNSQLFKLLLRKKLT